MLVEGLIIVIIILGASIAWFYDDKTRLEKNEEFLMGEIKRILAELKEIEGVVYVQSQILEEIDYPGKEEPVKFEYDYDLCSTDIYTHRGDIDDD